METVDAILFAGSLVSLTEVARFMNASPERFKILADLD